MYIENIKISNFRNLENCNLNFNNKLNIFMGNNAQGKTNIVEAIYLLAYGKSFRTIKDLELLKFEEDYFFIQADITTNNRKYKINISYSKKDNKKYIKINDIIQKKLSMLLGKVNIVIFKPDDIEIIKKGPQVRRKFLDNFILSLEPNYLEYIIKYNKVIEEKNKMLKKLRLENNYDDNLLDVYDNLLAELNFKIFNFRKKYLDLINEYIFKIHKKATSYLNYKEEVKIKYINNMQNIEQIYNELKRKRKDDIFKGYTSYGIHRDDFNIYLNGLLVDTYGSQGQQKSTILSLKLSTLEIIKEIKKDNPILILDDYMSELDEKRKMNFLKSIEDLQIFITTAEKIDILKQDNNIFNVNNGMIRSNNE